ncbi:MAG: autotransporter outer membrane beta-barrel domain-containing protein, partial [Myxococcota bacterium]
TITVTEANGAGIRGGDRNEVRNDGTIIVDGADGVGIDVGSIDVPDPTPSTPVSNFGTITLNGLGSVGIRSVDNYILRNEMTGLITIGAGATGGIGILGVDDNFVQSDGRITIDATDAIGISINDNTGVALPNGAVFGTGSLTTVNGDRSIGMQVGDNVGTAFSGNIDLIGDMTIGVSIGNKVDPFAQANHTNTNSATINVTGADSFGIRAGDGWVTGTDDAGTFVPTAAGIRNFGTINVDGDRSIGIVAGDGSFVQSDGTITIGVGATDAIGISITDNTTLDLSSSAVLGIASATTVSGAGSIGMQVGNDVGTEYSGMIDLIGDMTTGVSIGNKVDPLRRANHTNTATGTITITGADSFGIRAGNDWVAGTDDAGTFVPTAAGIRNFGTISVDGARSVGIFAGDNSSILSDSTITVDGTDAIGISVGASNLFDRWDLDDFSANVNIFNVDNTGGTITGGANAGPLVLFRDFVVGKENRLLNSNGSSILADVSGVAIRGSDGDEFIVNAGEIRGDVELMGGNDRIFLNDTFVQSGGTLFGGIGSDEIALGLTTGGTIGVFDASILDGFELMSIDGRDASSGTPLGWTIERGNTFSGTTSIRADGRLVVPVDAMNITQAVTLGGDLDIDPAGSILLVPDGTTTPLTVMGSAQLDGTLLVDRSQLALVAGSTRLIDVMGGIGATTFSATDVPATLGLFSLSTVYTPTAVDLLVTRATFAAVASSANRAAIGLHLDNIFADGTAAPALDLVVGELVNGVNIFNVDAVLDAINPEGYDAQTTILVESQRQIAHLLLDRRRDCSQGEFDPWQGSRAPLRCHARELSAWATATGSIRERDGFKDHTKYDADSYGITLGVDLAPIGDFEFTVAASGQRAQVDVAGAGESDIVIANLSGVASWSPGALRIQGVASYAFGSHEDRRDFGFNEASNTVNARASDQHESHTLGLSGQAGYLINIGSFSIEPIAGFDYAWVNQGEIAEKDAAVWGLLIDERDDQILSLRAGIQLSTVYHHTKYISTELLFLDGVWRPTLDLGWRQTVIGYEREITARLSGAPSAVGDFTIEGEEDRNGIEFGAGLSFAPDNANRLQFDLRYEGYRGKSTLEHDLIAKVRFGF